VRPGLGEPKLNGKERQAVACGSREQNARDVERVEDLNCGIPQSGGGQEVDVKASAMPDRLTAAQKRGELAKGRFGAGRSSKLLLPDACQPQDGFGNLPARVDKALHRKACELGRESDGADLDHSVSGRIETGRLEVESNVFRHCHPILRASPNGTPWGQARSPIALS